MSAGWAFAILALLLAGCAAPAATPGAVTEDVCAAPCAVLLDAHPVRPALTTVAVDPADPRHLVAASGPGYAYGWRLYETRDGGGAWEVLDLPVGERAPAGSPLAAVNGGAGMSVLVLDDGSVLLAATGVFLVAGSMVGAPPSAAMHVQYRAFVARTTDGGRTLEDVVFLHQSTGATLGGFSRLPEPAPDGEVKANEQAAFNVVLARGRQPGEVLATWLRTTWTAAYAFQGAVGTRDEEVVFQRSPDRGLTWTSPSIIDAASDQPGNPRASLGNVFLATAVAGERYAVAYVIPRGTSGHLGFATSEDGTRWERTDLGEALGAPTLKAAHERLFIAYPANTTGGELPRILASDDGGSTWIARDLAGPADSARTTPTIATDGRGHVYASFYRATGSDGGRERVAFRIAPDLTFSPLVILDRGNAGAAGAPEARGFWITAAGLPEGVYMVWPGFRDGDPALIGAFLS